MAMRILSCAAPGERRWRLSPVTIAIFFALALPTHGCATVTSHVKSIMGSSDDDTTDIDDMANANEGEPLPPPVANVAITYRRPGDALARATVIKFFGAEVIANHQRDASRTESVVRFDGGVPIWEFKADESTFGSITGVGGSKYSLKSVEYAKVPPHFTQILPEEGPPNRWTAAPTTSFRLSGNQARSVTRPSRYSPTDRFRLTTRSRARAAVTCFAATSPPTSPSR